MTFEAFLISMMAFIQNTGLSGMYISNLSKPISLNQKPYFLNESILVLSHFKIKYFLKKIR